MAGSESHRARAVLSDHDAVAATFSRDDGCVLDGWVVFFRELRLSDARSELRGSFWYEWNPADGLVDVVARGAIRWGERILHVKTVGGHHPVTTEPSLARIDFVDARHLRD